MQLSCVRVLIFHQDGNHSSQPSAPTAFKTFFEWCKLHLKQREWGRLDETSARYLKIFGLILRDPLETPGDAIKLLLDAVLRARITNDSLITAAAQVEDAGETEWTLPAGVDLAGRPIYQMRTILDHSSNNGRGVFLTSWEPTWELATNLPSAEVKKYRKRRRNRVERKFIEAEAHEE
ncbi:hypothetical protein PHMEG_0009874 [Phytophthora megakarya]|uniref:Uncharacterized protein n=1 Tax=Phytophthora megakarya TaxID=4795 RepID=A0A225WFD4_9STRA|nr:hypothetical protein PHMEG_0009874 [Phytophthora megakarya]